MPSFRKVKHSNFTVIDNCIFKDYSLSAKAKGILTQMLSLPDGWNYSIAGLTDLFSDGEYYFDCQDGTNAPVLSDGVLTLSARQMGSAGQATVRLKIDLRSGTLLP